jgi:hypothetical protein
MNIQKVLLSWKTVFTLQDLRVILWYQKDQSLRNLLQRRKKAWIVRKLQNWIWAFKEYELFELASKATSWSYISCETVLKQAWVIFQYYGSTVTCMSNISITKVIDWKQLIYKKLIDRIRLNPIWIQHMWNRYQATPERALCDMLYSSTWREPDNLDGINLQKLQHIASLYNVPRVVLPITKRIHDQSRNT